MTLDEAITHAEEKAEELRQEAKTWTNDGWQEAFIDLTPEKEAEFFEERQKEYNTCLECAEEHEQLAKWLKDYKQLLEMPKGDLISREALRATIIEPLNVNDACKNDWYEGYYTAKNEDVMAIDNAPTVFEADEREDK